jgi:glucose-6-phosphate isomerase
MNLRDHLKDILPEILPPNPAEAIKGTELIRLVRFRLGDEYSDATLRYHFSIMSCDPSSPISKVEQGQGYYLRRNIIGATAKGGVCRLALTELDRQARHRVFPGNRPSTTLAYARLDPFTLGRIIAL